MIIVLLLLFQSICLYCQRLVLRIHDRWINPKNARLLKEAAETKLHEPPTAEQRTKRRYTSAVAETCRFCANSPQGYCRHHFHLQELEVHKQQQRSWNLLAGGLDKSKQQYRQLRKINRELKRNLKNRLDFQQQQQQQQYLHKQCDYSDWGSLSSVNSDYPSTVGEEDTATEDCGYQSATSTLNLSPSPSSHSNSVSSGFISICDGDDTDLTASNVIMGPPFCFLPSTTSSAATTTASCSSHSTITTTYL